MHDEVMEGFVIKGRKEEAGKMVGECERVGRREWEEKVEGKEGEGKGKAGKWFGKVRGVEKVKEGMGWDGKEAQIRKGQRKAERWEKEGQGRRLGKERGREG